MILVFFFLIFYKLLSDDYPDMLVVNTDILNALINVQNVSILQFQHLCYAIQFIIEVTVSENSHIP